MAENQLKAADVARLLGEIVKNRLRYPFSLEKKVYWSGEPQSWFGLTDHPLDRYGGQISDPFSTVKKLTGKKAACVLGVEFAQRRGNSFFFKARCYNVYTLRETGMAAGSHEYIVKKRTRHREACLRLDILRPDTYRLRLAEGSEVPEHRTEMVCGDIARDTDVTFREDGCVYSIVTEALRLDIHRKKFCIEIRDAEGKLITESGGQTKSEWALAMDSWPLGFIRDRDSGMTFGVESFVLYPGEAVYGLGEKFSALNRVGQNIGLWNCEGIGNTTWRAYKHVPFFLSTRGYGVFVNESRPVNFWVGTREICKNVFAVEGDLIDYFFFAGRPREVLDAYTDLTGKPAAPPKWSFGTWMSRISYATQQQVLETAARLREMRFPCDLIHIDTNWFDIDWKCDWKFNLERFPDPAAMFRELDAMHFKTCLWQTPYVVDDLEIAREAREKGVLAENHGPFFFLTYPAHVIDMSRPEAVAWYQDKLRRLFDLGVASIKVDFGEGIERHQVFQRYSGSEMHNLFPLLYDRAVFEVTKEATGEGIIWARSAYAGSQRYPVHWSGDNSSTFHDLLCSLRGGLSLGMCGFTFWAQDCGGFTGTPSDKLYIRFTQLCILNSHIRYHGGGPRYREPWNYERETQETVRELLNLRYRLIPYIYSESRHAAAHGWPLVAALVLEYPDDPNVYDIDHQFLFGRDLLAAPILTKEDERKVYIPAGGWYDFWTGERFEGPRWIDYPCPIERMPLFAREGSILPLGPVMQYVGEREAADELTLMVFPGPDGTAACHLEDEEGACVMHARTEDGELVVMVEPGVERLAVEYPEGCGIRTWRSS